MTDKVKKFLEKSYNIQLEYFKEHGQNKDLEDFKSPNGKIRFFNDIAKIFFNPNCTHTVLEEGNDEEIAKKIASKNNSYDPKLYEFFLKSRKNLYNGKSKLLIDNIYQKFNTDEIKQKLKDINAKSYCHSTDYYINTFLKGGRNKSQKSHKSRKNKTRKTRQK
jgi:hypothetical protein